MPALPRISGRTCCTALAKLGFVLVRQRGSHMLIRRAEPRTTFCIRSIGAGMRDDLLAYPHAIVTGHTPWDAYCGNPERLLAEVTSDE